LVAVTVCPRLLVSPSAVSGGYGRQWQFVPRGTESPSATMDHVCGEPDADAVARARGGVGDVAQPATMQPSMSGPASALPRRRVPISRV
jgi:hypothetical protein